MRVLLDANVLLDCLVLEASGQPRQGKLASEQVLTLCDAGVHRGLVAWHTLPIVAYYYGRQHTPQDTGAMMDGLLAVLEVPMVGHLKAADWRSHGLDDFEDALQVASAQAGMADVLITRNLQDFAGCAMPVLSPEAFLASSP